MEQVHKDLGDQQNPHLSTSFAPQCDDIALTRESEIWKILHSILPPCRPRQTFANCSLCSNTKGMATNLTFSAH